MPYPYAIGTTSDQPSFPYASKIYKRGTDLYTILYSTGGGTAKLTAWKSTDAGVTWSEQDSAGRPLVNNTSSYQATAIHDTGAELVCAYMESTATPVDSRIIEFDPSTDSWGAAITGGPIPDSLATTSSQNPNAQIGIIKRGTNDYVLVYTKYDATFGTASLWMNTYTGSWGTAAELLGTGTTETLAVDYTLTGMLLMTSGSIRVFAFTEQYVLHTIIDIAPDNSVTADDRDDGDAPSHALGGARYEVWGAPELVYICDQEFTALPIGKSTTSAGSGNWHVPGLMLIPATATNRYRTYVDFRETMKVVTNWNSCSVTYDASTSTIYVAWTKTNPSSGDSDVRYSCFKGKGWSAPSSLFTTDFATYNVLCTLEIAAVDGTMRAMHWNGFETWYWQASATCSADSCSGGASAFYGAA